MFCVSFNFFLKTINVLPKLISYLAEGRPKHPKLSDSLLTHGALPTTLAQDTVSPNVLPWHEQTLHYSWLPAACR